MDFSKYIAFPYIVSLEQQKLLINHFVSQEALEMSEMLNERSLTVKELGFTYRQINTWDEHKLLGIKRKGAEWRTFSLMDKIWLCLIRELRAYGISLKKIASIKKFLEMDGAISYSKMPMLELYTAHAAARKIASVIVVFEDGSALVTDFGNWLDILLTNKTPNHLIIHLNPIFSEVFSKTDITPDYTKIINLDREEFRMLKIIREGKYESVKIKYKNGKAEILEGMQRIEVDKKIIDLLREKNYQSIEVNQHDGKVKQIIRWEKVKLS